MSDTISVEVAFALPDKQALVEIELADGATVNDAIVQADLKSQFPDYDFGKLPVGVWGHPVSRDHRLEEGDRVEIYRALKLDPRDTRRRLALAGRTMGQALDDDR